MAGRNSEDNLDTYPPPATNMKVKRNVSKQATTDAPFRFLDLIPEIRNMFYKMLLVDEEETVSIDQNKGIAIRRLMTRREFAGVYGGDESKRVFRLRQFSGESSRYWWNARLGVQIVQVNKQICNEALPLLYPGNHFAFRDLPAMDAFLGQIGNHIKELRKCSLVYWGV